MATKIQEKKNMTFEDYIAKPFEERHLGILYKEPISLSCGEWPKWEKYIIKQYPVQYFFREVIIPFFRRIRARIKWKYYNIRDYFRPKQKWILNGVSNSFQDKVELVPLLIFNCIKHLVEEEKIFETISTYKNKDCPKGQAKFTKELEKVYGQIIIELPNLQLELDEAWENVRDDRPTDNLLDWVSSCKSKEDYQKVYGEVDRLEAEIEKLKTDICIWAVKNRAHFWT
jgi:hypothetical protein